MSYNYHFDQPNKRMTLIPTAAHTNHSIGRSIYVNPCFDRGQNMFVNPKFVFQQPQSSTHIEAPNSTFRTECDSKKYSTNNSQFSWRRQGNTNNIKVQEIVQTNSLKPVVDRKNMVYICPSKRKIIRNSNKPIINNINNVHSKTRFKVDKRPLRPNSDQKWKQKCTTSLQSLFPKSLFRINRYKISRNNHSVIKKDLNSSRTASTKAIASRSKKLVNIGGICYSVTTNKLTRASGTSISEPIKRTITTTPTKKRKTVSAKHIINIRNEKFILCRNGRTLQRLETTKTTARPLQRIDFGGVTFRQTSHNVLVRTESHLARSILLKKRQRSIACLTSSLRKSNEPCLVFIRLGRCLRFDRGQCSFTHDRKQIALCKMFLRGKCTDKNCLLSHDAVHQKVDTCKYFLDGVCTRENCPYLHVKVSEGAKICKFFLQGYCELGQQCSNRHINICPEFEKSGKCRKGKLCPHPHKTQRKLKNTSNKQKWKKTQTIAAVNEKRLPKHKAESTTTDSSNPEGTRYYISELEAKSQDQTLGIVPKRQRLSTLPSFISFDVTSDRESIED